MPFEYKKFNQIDLSDPFFNSLKADYAEFPKWFAKKAADYAYVFSNDNGKIDGFLYLKIEDGSVDDTTPPLPPERRIKVGTLKINAHGTKLGERFIKKIFDHAIYEKAKEIYLTVFEHHQGLLMLMQRYGFEPVAKKNTVNGSELVLLKKLSGAVYKDVTISYPLLHLGRENVYLLALYPKWHTRLLPDSILKNEDSNIVQDISHTNSIHKVYLGAMEGMQALKRGDILLIYRTNDGQGPAHYRSVATSICVVEEYRSILSFASTKEFLDYCLPYSVFNDTELVEFFRHKRYPHVIRFTYNIALRKRVTRGTMIEEIGLTPEGRWGFMNLTYKQFEEIAKKGMVDESLIIH